MASLKIPMTTNIIRNKYGLSKDVAYHLMKKLIESGHAKRVNVGEYNISEYALNKIKSYSEQKVKEVETPQQTPDTKIEVKEIEVPKSKLQEGIEKINASIENEKSELEIYQDAALEQIARLKREKDIAYDWRAIYTQVFNTYAPKVVRAEPIILHSKSDWEYIAFLQISDIHANPDRLMQILPKMESILKDISGRLTKIVLVLTGDLMDNTHLYPGQQFIAVDNNARQQVNSGINIIKLLEFIERLKTDNSKRLIDIDVYWCLGNHTREAPFPKGGPPNAFDNWEHGMMLYVSEFMKKSGSRARFFSPDQHKHGYIECPVETKIGRSAIEMWPYMTFYESNCVIGISHGHTVRVHNRTPHYGIEHLVQKWSNSLRDKDHILQKLFFMGHFHRSIADKIGNVHFYMGGSLQEINAHGVNYCGKSDLSQNLVIWKTSGNKPIEWGFHRLNVAVE